jgi:hypothetical protein
MFPKILGLMKFAMLQLEIKAGMQRRYSKITM